MSTQAFSPSRELTFSTVQSDGKRFQTLLRQKNTTAISLNLQAVEQCDSAGLAFLIEAKRLCKQQQKVLTIEGMPKAIYALAEFCGVDAILLAPTAFHKV